MFLYRLKSFLYTAVAVVFCLLLTVGVKAANVSRLSELQGERTFFLDSASSQGLMKAELSFFDLSRVKGECVSFILGTYEGGRYASSEDIVKAIARQYGAEILMKEEVLDVTSYYCYTPRWADYILIEGKAINLHVAVSKEKCAVGAPIIFGGF